MGVLEGIDYGTAGLLAGIALLEGLRRVPAGALVLRRPMWDGWRVADEPATESRTTMVSWWAPFTVSVLVPPVKDGAPHPDPGELASRWTTARRFTPALAVLGGLTLASLVLGIPFAIAKAGVSGFLAGLIVTAAASVATGAVCGAALRALGASRGTAWRRGLACLSPFAAPRAIEVVHEAALASATPLAATRVALSPVQFRAWIRPAVWDHLAGDPALAELGRLIPPSEMAALVADPGSGAEDGGSTFCPRCGSAWRLSDGSCPACPDGITLRPLRGR
ncbi:MAG: hypothetical protein ACREMH_07855 [Gemmatimonadales bacterium]